MGRVVLQFWPRVPGWIVVVAAAAMLAGCVAPYGERVEPEPLAQDRMLGPDAALVAPPVGGPTVIGVIQRTYRNAVRQTIILQTDGSVSGENTFEVTFYGPLRAAPDAGNLKRDTGTLTEIAGEMRRKIPLPMAISPEYAQNSYGPFGFAFGGNSAGRCLYAWQRIHAQRNIFQEPSARGEISLRLRLCRRGVTDAQLLAVMYGYAIVATLPNPNWNPFGTPPPADPEIGQRGVSINPLADDAAAQGDDEVVALDLGGEQIIAELDEAGIGFGGLARRDRQARRGDAGPLQAGFQRRRVQGGQVLIGDDGGARSGEEASDHLGRLAELMTADQDVIGALGQRDRHDDGLGGGGGGDRGVHHVVSRRRRWSSAAIASSTTTSCGSSRDSRVMSASA